MDLKAYNSIRSRLDFRRRPSMLFRQIGIDSALVALSLYLLKEGGTAGYFVAQGILPVVMFRGFSLMHEAVHHTAARTRWINDFVGVVAGIACFMPYESWKRLHREHHFWAGNIEQDPSSKLRKDYDPSRKLKYSLLTAIWRSWLPLLGLMQLLVFWVYPARQLRNRNYSRYIKALIVISVLTPLATYGFLVYRWPELFNPVNFGPAVFLYLMIVEVINFPHHMDVYAFTGPGRLPLPEQYKVTRSSYYPLWLSRNFLLNFNLHTEHHLFPTLPWYQLDRARPLVKDALGGAYNESLGNAWIRKNRKLDLNELLPLSEPSESAERYKKAG